MLFLWPLFSVARSLATDSTIAPPEKPQRFSFNERFMAARREEVCYEKQNHHILSRLQKRRSNYDVGGAIRGAVFQEKRPGAG